MVYVNDLKADNAEQGHQAEAAWTDKTSIGSEARHDAAAAA